MIEIRTIQAEETERYLALICSVFDLDIARARTVFTTEPYFDLNRKWALFDNGRMVSILTTTPLLFGWGKAIGIAGVATTPEERRRGYSSRLLQHVLRHSKAAGEGPALLFAKDQRLYARHGFETIDSVIGGAIDACGASGDVAAFRFDQVQAVYDRWASQSPHRLRRDEKRWLNWKWHYRCCEPLADGYIALEPGTLREVIYWERQRGLPVAKGTDWLGLSSVADSLALPLLDRTPEMWAMTLGFPDRPQMFLTDQF